VLAGDLDARWTRVLTARILRRPAISDLCVYHRLRRRSRASLRSAGGPPRPGRGLPEPASSAGPALAAWNRACSLGSATGCETSTTLRTSLERQCARQPKRACRTLVVAVAHEPGEGPRVLADKLFERACRAGDASARYQRPRFIIMCRTKAAPTARNRANTSLLALDSVFVEELDGSSESRA
jgi:hypothetical protein